MMDTLTMIGAIVGALTASNYFFYKLYSMQLFTIRTDIKEIKSRLDKVEKLMTEREKNHVAIKKDVESLREEVRRWRK